MREASLALIDLGSNTVRLVIYSIPGEGGLEERFNSVKKIGENRKFLGIWSQRLGDTLTEEGFQQLTSTLLEQKRQAQEAGCSHVFCFATASLRGLSHQVMERLSKQTGLSVRLLSQEEEAQCDCESLRLFSSGQSQALGCDIGGGSGQLFAYREQQRFGISLPLGSLRLASQWVTGKLPTQREAVRLQEYLDHQLLAVPFLSAPYPCLYAMGGSARAVKTLACAIGLWREETSSQLPLSLLDSLQDRLFCPDGESLLSRFLPERIRTFPIGLMVLRAVARQADVPVICPLKNGVREGVLWTLLQGTEFV